MNFITLCLHIKCRDNTCPDLLSPCSGLYNILYFYTVSSKIDPGFVDFSGTCEHPTSRVVVEIHPFEGASTTNPNLLKQQEIILETPEERRGTRKEGQRERRSKIDIEVTFTGRDIQLRRVKYALHCRV